jgi:H+/Cl- antiporter ClcA
MDAQAIALTVAGIISPVVVDIGRALIQRIGHRELNDSLAFVWAALVAGLLGVIVEIVVGHLDWHNVPQVWDAAAKTVVISQAVFWVIYKPLLTAVVK